MKTRILLGCACILTLGLIAHAQSSSNRTRTLVQKVSPSIVTVRAVVKVDVKAGGESHSDEAKFSQRGAILSEDGVVMISSSILTAESFAQLMDIDPEDLEKVDLKLSPQSFKVIFEQESKEYDAQLVATDSQLGLAFLKIKDLQGRTLKPVEFKENPLELGSELFCVTRMPKGYDFVPYLMKLMVVAEVSKPRKAYVLDVATSEQGLPVFDAEGFAVGVISTIRPAAKSDGEEDLGFSSGTSECVLPVATVRPVIQQAIQRARAQ